MNRFKIIFLILVFAAVWGGYMKFFSSEPDQNKPTPLSSKGAKLSLEEGIKKRSSAISAHQQKMRKKFAPLKKDQPAEKDFQAESSLSKDSDLVMANDTHLQAIVDELKEPPFRERVYDDPQAVIRRRMAQSALHKVLRHKDKDERQEFIDRFVKIANEQGYKVRFYKDLKVVLEPFKPKVKPPLPYPKNVEQVPVRY